MSGTRDIRNIALIGFMGTGKSSVGRLIADQLHFSLVDTDEIIESRAGKTIAAIFAGEGEPAFRQYERDVVAELALRKRTVISTGGGVGANEANLASLKEHALVVCLWASPEKIWERVRHQTHRPLLQEADPLAKIRQLLAGAGTALQTGGCAVKHGGPFLEGSRATGVAPVQARPVPAVVPVKAAIQQRARELGFDDCRFSAAHPPETSPQFKHWLAEGRHGEMAYLERNAEKRIDPQRVLAGAKSIVVVGGSV